MLRMALVGIGDAGKHHARALGQLAAEGHLAFRAVCGRDAAKLAAFRAELGLPSSVASFTSLDALLAAGACDAVILATPDGLHRAQVERAAGHGLHVLVEKPLALSRADGEAAAASARAAGVHLAVGYHLRHHAAHRLVMERLGEMVGRVRTVHVRWAWPDPATDGWRARGEGARFWSLAALGTHAVDLALMFAGGHPGASEVAAITVPPGGIDRAAEVSLRLGEVLAHVSVSVVHRAVSRVIVSGNAGEVEAVGTLGARGDGELFHRAPRKSPAPVAFEALNPYVAQLRAFVARAPAGFAEDASMIANLDILDRIPGDPAHVIV